MAATAVPPSRGRTARQHEKIVALGGKPWKPSPTTTQWPVFHLRDQPMEPERGVEGDLLWFHFVGSLQLWLPLDTAVWDGITEDDLVVSLRDSVLSARCTAKDLDAALQCLNRRLRKEVNPKLSWFSLARDPRDGSGQSRILILHLAKKQPGVAYPVDRLFAEAALFSNRKNFGWTDAQLAAEQDAQQTVEIPRGRRSDVNDPFTTSRGWLCTELEQGQTDELLHWRIVLDQKKLDQVLGKVPYYQVFGLDCSEQFLKLFVRGDESSPVLLGRFPGKVSPHLSTMELTSLTREVYGHKIAGTMETVPVLNVTLVKATLGQWEELLEVEERDLNQPQGTLEEYQELCLRRERDPSPDRTDWTPDDWADEQKEKADAAFKAGSFADAIVYYSRALKHTPLNEKLLSNRSAAFMKTAQYREALADAEKAIEIQPGWAKVYFRKGLALKGLRRYEDAVEAFKEGQHLEPDNPDWEKEQARCLEAQAAWAAKKGSKASAR